MVNYRSRGPQRASARPLGGAPWGGGVAHKRTEAPRADRKSPKQGAQGAPRGDPRGPEERHKRAQRGPRRPPPKAAHTSTYSVPLWGALSKPSSRLLGALLKLLGQSAGAPRPSWRGPRGRASGRGLGVLVSRDAQNEHTQASRGALSGPFSSPLEVLSEPLEPSWCPLEALPGRVGGVREGAKRAPKKWHTPAHTLCRFWLPSRSPLRGFSGPS